MLRGAGMLSLATRWRGSRRLTRAGRLMTASLVVAAVGCGGEARPAAPATGVARTQGYDPAPWRADYAGLREALGAGYANFEWMLAHRGIDPYALNQRTLAAIEAARSDLDGLW